MGTQETLRENSTVTVGSEWVACARLPGFAASLERARCPELTTRPSIPVEQRGVGARQVRDFTPEVISLFPSGASKLSPEAVLPHCQGVTPLPRDGPFYHRHFTELHQALDAINPAIEA